MTPWKSQNTAIGSALPVSPVLEIQERFGLPSMLVQLLIVGFGIYIFSLTSIPAAAFLLVAVVLRAAWMLTHRRKLVWDGHDLWLVTGQERTHAARGGAGEIRQLAVRRSSPNSVTRRYYVVVNAEGAGTARLPISQWDPHELAALASAAGLGFTDYGLIPSSDAAVLDPSPADKAALIALGVFAIAMAIAWHSQG